VRRFYDVLERETRGALRQGDTHPNGIHFITHERDSIERVSLERFRFDSSQITITYLTVKKNKPGSQ
jgi:hypothetical protein